MMAEIFFDKYERKGAYHWAETTGSVHRLNAYTLGRYEQVLAALGRIPPEAAILDVGCGDGALAGAIAARLGCVVEGVDVDELPITLARNEFKKRGLRGRFQVISGYRYPFTDGAFAAVVSSDVIEHVQKPQEMLLEMWRVLAPGGTLIVTTPIRYTETPLDRMHVNEWFAGEFKTLCEQALGVTVEIRRSHPVALAELYGSSSPILGRIARFSMNVLAKLGFNPFLRTKGFRAASAQTMIAMKPASLD
jgi:2-polyprenyl-3-methyl-5-hydroxy-6-metoxy-1,4-benzoquinol methylase